jgi:hypothetical protein
MLTRHHYRRPNPDRRRALELLAGSHHGYSKDARIDFGERWPSRLVATAEEDGLSIWRNPHARLRQRRANSWSY